MAVGVFVGCEENFRKRAEYMFNQMFSMLGISYQLLSDMHDVDENVHHLIISYGTYILKNYPNKCIINIFHEDANEKNNEWYHQLYESQPPEVSYIFTQTNDKIPYLYSHVSFDEKIGRALYEYANANDKPNVAVQSIESERGLIINIGFDLVKSAFFLLSREEELMCNERDAYNRFSAKFSVAHRNNFITIPVIDEYIKILNELIALSFEKIKIPLIQKCLWPQNKDFAVCLTHDVDCIKKWTRRSCLSQFMSSGISLFKRELKQSINELIPAIKSVLKDPYWTFEEILIAEEKYGFKSSFYFCASGPHKVDPEYNIHSKKIKRLISDIYKKGCEVGLHGSFDSYNDYELLFKEKQSMEKSTGLEIMGIRQHYLRFKYPDTWRLQEKIGFKYDTTLGYADEMGFRASTTFPFYPYDLQGNRVINVLEIPLTIMDATLKGYLKVAPKDAFIQIKNLLETVKKSRGVAVLLWHNDVFDNEDNPGWGEVYYKSLEYLAGQNAWVTSGKEIADWWITRNSLKCIDVEISKDKNKWSFRAEKDIESIWFKISGLNNKDNVFVEGAKSYKIRNINNTLYLEIENINTKKNKEVIITLWHNNDKREGDLRVVEQR